MSTASGDPSAKPIVRGAFSSETVKDWVCRFAGLWRASASDSPPLGRAFTPQEQFVREKALERCIEDLTAETKRLPRNPTEREDVRKRIFSIFELFARSAWDWEDRHLRILFSNGFDRAAIEFARMARQFDPGVGTEDILQACRNVWVMNGIQILLGLPVRMTPAIFAYSMLYPYTDNYLDDAAIPEENKRSFNERFGLRLEGRNIAPGNSREKIIFDLVSRIEEQYERSRHEQVFESLLAIHRAQEKSLRLLHSGGMLSDEKVLEICLEKGGTSVLADGCLVAGSLTPSQAEFLFGWGAFLQLVDDQEDVLEDSRAGLLTLFSQTAGRSSLDELTDRALGFRARVLEPLDAFGVPDSEPLKELIKSNMVQILIGSAGRNGRCYSRSYLRRLEAHSPFRFSFGNKQRRKLERRRAALARLFEAFALMP